MTASPQQPAPPGTGVNPRLALPRFSLSWALALRFAARELRGGVKGFRVMLACLTLGVAAIAAIGSFSAAVNQGHHMLLRDLQAEIVHRDIAAWARDPRAALPSGADRNGNALFAEEE